MLDASTTDGDADDTDADDAAGPDWRRRLGSTLRAVGPAILIYEGIRLFMMVVLYAVLHRHGISLFHQLSHRHDAGWYAQIATIGYEDGFRLRPDGSAYANNLAFFPLFPAIIVAIKTVTGLTAYQAGVVAAWIAGVAAAWGLFRMGEHLASRRAGIMLVVVWATLPHSFVQSAGYTETLFVALSAWCLLALLRRQWFTAGILCLLAGASRPSANALILVVGVAGLVALFQRRDGWRPLLAVVLAPLGYLGYLAWVGARLGRVDGYLYLQKTAWGVSFDGGRFTLRTLRKLMFGPDNNQLGYWAVAFMILVSVVLFLLTVIDRNPWQLILYSAASVAFVLGAAGSFTSKGRYLMVIFTLLIPVAVGLAKASTAKAVVLLTALTLLSTWYAVYLNLQWQWSP